MCTNKLRGTALSPVMCRRPFPGGAEGCVQANYYNPFFGFFRLSGLFQWEIEKRNTFRLLQSIFWVFSSAPKDGKNSRCLHHTLGGWVLQILHLWGLRTLANFWSLSYTRMNCWTVTLTVQQNPMAVYTQCCQMAMEWTVIVLIQVWQETKHLLILSLLFCSTVQSFFLSFVSFLGINISLETIDLRPTDHRLFLKYLGSWENQENQEAVSG